MQLLPIAASVKQMFLARNLRSINKSSFCIEWGKPSIRNCEAQYESILQALPSSVVRGNHNL